MTVHIIQVGTGKLNNMVLYMYNYNNPIQNIS